MDPRGVSRVRDRAFGGSPQRATTARRQIDLPVRHLRQLATVDRRAPDASCDRQNVSPKTALSVGLKVDVDALPPSVIDALKAGHLDDPSVTVQLLKLNAVVGVMGKVVGANDNLATVGITCALCAEWSESRGGETRRGSVHGRGGLCGVSYAAAVYGRGKRAGSECAGPPRNI